MAQSEEKQKKSKKKVKDPCLICEGELYLDGEYTQRVGLISEMDDVYGWMCPHCKATFDEDSAFTGIQGMDEMGET